jgi:hypothetical protein
MSPQNGNGKVPFEFFWALPDDRAFLRLLLSLAPAELKVTLFLAWAIQRHSGHGLAAWSFIAVGTGLSRQHAGAAVDSLCQKGLFVRVNRATGGLLTDPKDWTGKTVKYGFHPKWKQKVTDNQSPVGDQLPPEPSDGIRKTLNQSPVGDRNQSPVGDRNLECLRAARAPQNSGFSPVFDSERESSSSQSSEPVTETEKPDDDATFFPQNETNTPEAEAATAIEAVTVPEAGNSEADDDLVAIAQAKLHEARATSLSPLHVATPEGLAVTIPPDRKITRDILQAFADAAGPVQGGADFEAWLNDTVSRGLGRKAESTRYGLYLADAKTEAQNLVTQRAAMLQVDAARQVEQARRQAEQAQAEAAAAAEAERPMAPAEAFERIRPDIGARGVPRWLKAQLERTREFISPNALKDAILGRKRCPECQDRGQLGSALDQTLKFCDCAAGIEAAELPTGRELEQPAAERFHRGPDWPAAETARVHAGAQSRLVDACHDIGRPFAADAIEASSVIDTGGVLEIRLPPDRFGVLVESDVRAALARLGWQRRIAITGGPQAKQQPAAAPATKPAAAAPSRAPITQADIDREVRRQKQPAPMPPGREGGGFADMAAAGGVQ